jgi:GTP-binding protein HflX
MTTRSKAILVAVQLPGVSEEEHEGSLAELERLVHTLGFEVIAKLSQKRKAPHPGTLVGEGKLEELSQMTKELSEQENDKHATTAPKSVVIFDSELSPSQLKNIEDATLAEVMDRTGVILEIFNRHAHTREAKLQVEIAKLAYIAPRLRASHVGADRQGGGIGAKGSGETAHELDKRRIRDRISELRRQLAQIASDQDNRRSHRSDSNRVALVGYTNAGKSSLMRALTNSEVLVADKLFATLDTTVRVLKPETVPKILVSDTVGFIKKLPHDLVASFRSTLDEAHAAKLLLFVVDASDVTFRSQLEVTKTVLAEIGADTIPSKLVLNKIDRLTAEELKLLRHEFADAIFISTLNATDVSAMHQLILSFFEKEMEAFTVEIGYERSDLVHKIRSLVRITDETHDDSGYRLSCMGAASSKKLIEDWLREPEVNTQSD